MTIEAIAQLLEAERDALKARVETLEWAIAAKDKQIIEYSEEVNKRGARVAQLESALRWYANENYRAVKYEPDFGERARAALATKEFPVVSSTGKPITQDEISQKTYG